MKFSNKEQMVIASDDSKEKKKRGEMDYVTRFQGIWPLPGVRGEVD